MRRATRVLCSTAGGAKQSVRAVQVGMVAAAAMFITVSPPVLAESNVSMLKKAVQEYQAGDYNSSAGHFYAVLTTEFNNPSVHYYMASCYVHLKDPESAVREFRIAYALAPNSDVGSYATTALKYFGLNTDGSLVSKPPGAVPDSSAFGAAGTNGSSPAANTAASKPSTSDKSLDLLHAQVEREKNSHLEQSKKNADDIQHQGDDRISKAITAAGGNGAGDPKDRDKEILRLPDDTKSVLSNLKSEYDARLEKQLDLGKTQAAKLDESAANLQRLIEQDHSVQAAGSNLYVRNYKKTGDSRNTDKGSGLTPK